jgi:hypothetical protein
MKKFNAPELNVKKFNRVSILTDSVVGPTTTNVEAAKAALTGSGVAEGNIKKITL